MAATEVDLRLQHSQTDTEWAPQKSRPAKRACHCWQALIRSLTTAPTAGAAYSRSYLYDGSNRLTSISQGGTLSWQGTYDPRGNLIDRNGQALAFDRASRLTSIPGIANYEYDGHGRRTAQWRADGTVRVSLYTLDGRLQGEADNRAVGSTDYIYLGGTLVAKRFQHWSGIPPLVTYLHSDGLGSPVLETDATGAVLSRERFLSYGGAVDGAVKDAVGYTGHQEDPASGLVYMQQRYYDPAAGVFTSVDPVAAFGNPIGQFHRYRYANNNPYRFVDPDGQACTTADMRVSCVPNMRKGHDLPSFSFEKPDGWPKEIGLSWIKSHEYRYEDSTQGKSDASVQLVIVRDPSPGRDRPATLRGTPNDASPASGWRGPIAKGAGGSPIKSYSFYDENGNTWVVNVTMPGHPLFPGYVLRGAVDGKIITYGEGDGWLQALGPFSQIGINDEFKRANADAVKNAE